MKKEAPVKFARLVAALIVGVGSLLGFDAVGAPDAAASSTSQVAVEERGGGGPASQSPGPATAMACRDLRTLTGYEFSVDTAEVVAAGAEAPEHCRVTGQILPQVRFEVRLPTDWNGRLMMVGNGGYAGSISPAALDRFVSRGFAAAGTDTGHNGVLEPLGTFATDRQKLIDFAYRAVHVTTITTKQIIAAHYEPVLDRAYFSGCSTGGRQGLMAAQRFPDDFDGIIVGAPVLDFTSTMIGYLWIADALRAAPIEAGKLGLLAEHVYA